MATLMLDEGGGADFEIEYSSVGEYRERLDRVRVIRLDCIWVMGLTAPMHLGPN
jgi:hypothetical protein